MNMEDTNMMIEEFEQRTGIYPDRNAYHIIESYYAEFNGGKDAFCAAYKANKDGLAEQVQRTIDSVYWRIQREEDGLRDKIKQLEEELEQAKAALDRELEWKPYEDVNNVPQASYEKLANGAETGRGRRYMTDEEAVAWICSEFDFDPSKITIIHEVDEYEINRHCRLRKTGRKIDRRPVYCATDYYYIRFNTLHWCYEIWNGQLRPLH